MTFKTSTKSEALRRRDPRYFTGKPCKHGHIAERYTRSGTCVVCMQIFAEAKSAEYAALRILHPLPPAPPRERMPPDELKARARARKSARHAVRYKNDARYAAIARIQSLVAGSFSRIGLRKNSKTEAILGCSLDAFLRHIERQFLPGMSWENRRLWHVDHIVPISTAVTMDDVLALNRFTNLRPMWGPDNIRKRDKVLFLL